jgi:hypothetical protein
MTVIYGELVPSEISQADFDRIIDREVHEATQGLSDPELRELMTDVVKRRVVRETSAQWRSQAAILRHLRS